MTIRKSNKDIWNAFMVKGASFSKNDIPLCPTTAVEVPKKVISYKEARTIYKKEIKKNPDFKEDSYVHFYIDDYVFDGKRKGIWVNPKEGYKVLSHFEGIIVPDFSTYLDFPYPLKLWNYYRMYAFGYWHGTICRKNVIVQARWDYKDSFSYCFDGIKEGDMVCIGTVASGLKKLENRERFEIGLKELIRLKHPSILIIIGTINIPIFKEIEKEGIKIIHFQSETDLILGGYKHVKRK